MKSSVNNFLPRIVILLVASFLLTSLSVAQSRDVVVSLGLGSAFPSEPHPLNIPGETGLNSALSGNMGMHWPAGDMGLIGWRMFLTAQSLPGYQVLMSGSTTPQTVEFKLTSYAFLIDAQLFLVDSRSLKPYLLAAVGYSGGTLTHTDFGTLRYQGFSAGGGLGVRLAITDGTSLSVDAMQLFGSGNWKEKPFQNSESDKFDPTCTWVSCSVSFLVPR